MKKKTNKHNIIIFVLLLAFGVSCGAYYYLNYAKEQPKTANNPEIVDVDKTSHTLGLLEDTKAPELIIQNTNNTIYIGNDNYDFEPLAYDEFGDVEITYNDEQVDYDKAGTYQITVIATDKTGNTTSKEATLTVENKPVVTRNNYVRTGSSSSSSSGSTSSSSSGGGNAHAEMQAWCDTVDYATRSMCYLACTDEQLEEYKRIIDKYGFIECD